VRNPEQNGQHSDLKTASIPTKTASTN